MGHFDFFGGSLSLSAALTETGVTQWLSHELQIIHNVPPWLVISVVVLLVVGVSEMMSNSAMIPAFLPILAGLSGGLGIHPFLIMIAATLAGSCAFMMPGASPPEHNCFQHGKTGGAGNGANRTLDEPHLRSGNSTGGILLDSRNHGFLAL